MASIGAICPYKCTGIIAFVEDETACFNAEISKLNVWFSTSTSTGFKPACFMAIIVAIYVLEATITSSASFILPRTLYPSKIRRNASKPLPTPTQYCVSQ